MFKIQSQNKKLHLFVAILSIFSGIGASDSQNNEYESRVRQAEYATQKLLKPTVAVFDIHGNTDLKKLTLDLIKVAKDSKINGIFLWIDSGGGRASVFSSVHDTLLRIRKQKPVVVLVTGCAFSGGYLIASAADYIFASSAASIGSIGAMATIKRYKNPKIKENGIEADMEVTLFTAGDYKAPDNVFRIELSEDDKNYIQKNLEISAQQFIGSVALNRNLDIAKTDEWANAKEFIAHKAVALGLIDEVGTAFEAEAKIVELIRAKNPDKLVSATVEYIFFGDVAPTK